MTPEPAPEITNPPPAAQPPAQPAETGEARKKKSGLPGRFIRIAQWFDRDLDLERRDTSDWNIYYYYFRQVAQHHAPVKLKYMKWIALIFQLYFFGMLALASIRMLFLPDDFSGSGKISGGKAAVLVSGFASTFGVTGGIFFMAFLLLFVPVSMVVPAFRLRNKAQGLMTSRAKEPPLLAHLVQYTSSKGLVQGALQSLAFTWKRMVLLLSPCIVVTVLLLIAFAATEHTETAFKLAFAAPAGVVLCVLTASLFFLLQPFCYRLDSVLVAIGIGIEAFLLASLGIVSSNNAADFWVFFSACFIPSCLFAIVYFPLAAADTGELCLGKRTSKRLRILLYAAGGFFLAAMLLATGASSWFMDHTGNTSDLRSTIRSFEAMTLFFVSGFSVCVCGLLISSLSVTSPLAARQLQTRAKEPFLKKLFDPASPLSLLPVIVLELVAFATASFLTSPNRLDLLRFSVAFAWIGRGRTAWTVIHFGLALAYARQRRKPEMKAPWEFHVRFNMTCIVGYVAIQLLLTLTTAKGAGFIGLVLYIVSIIVLFTVFGLLKSSKSTFKVEDPEAEQNREEAS